MIAKYRSIVLFEYFIVRRALDKERAIFGGIQGNAVMGIEQASDGGESADSDERMSQVEKTFRNCLPPSAGNSQRIVSGFHLEPEIACMRRTKSSE
jgi:hypothetical protein